MKKTIVLFSTLALISLNTFAQNKDAKQTDKVQAVAAPAPVRQAPVATPQPATPAQNPDLGIKFTDGKMNENTKTYDVNHNFGNVPEGPSVSYDFEFKNIGKVPIIFSDVHGSCGCTVPTWPKEPILPGKTNKITVTYSTQGRQGQINKTVTVTSNVGTKILTISGNVDKAADAAQPGSATPTDVKH